MSESREIRRRGNANERPEPPLDGAVNQMTGAAALPRRNGELVFDAPWQGRAFGLALELVRALGLPWSEFQRHLIAAIARRPAAAYYESWVEALERLTREHGLTSEAELASTSAALLDEDTPET